MTFPKRKGKYQSIFRRHGIRSLNWADSNMCLEREDKRGLWKCRVRPFGKKKVLFGSGCKRLKEFLLPIPAAYSDFGEGNGNPLQYSCLENPTDGGACWVAVHGVARSQTRLSDFTLFFHFHALEKEMATHSSVLAWRIPGTGEPGGLPSLGLQSWTWLKWLSSSSSNSDFNGLLESTAKNVTLT